MIKTKHQTCDGYEWRDGLAWKCILPPGHKTPEGEFLGRSCQGIKPDYIITAGHDDATTCPGCRVAVRLGQFCSCPVRWRG